MHHLSSLNFSHLLQQAAHVESLGRHGRLVAREELSNQLKQQTQISHVKLQLNVDLFITVQVHVMYKTIELMDKFNNCHIHSPI